MSRKISVTKYKRKSIHDNVTPNDDDDMPLSRHVAPVIMKKPKEPTAKRKESTTKSKDSTVKQKNIVNPIQKVKKETKRPRITAMSGMGAFPKRPKLDDDKPTQKCNLILSCGNGDTGQLGLGEDVTACKRPKAIQTFVPKVDGEFLQIAAGGMHSVVLTADHKVYTCGCNDEGALGRDCFDDDDDATLREDDQDFKFRPVIFDDGLIEKHGHVVQISAGDSHTAALTNKGSVIIWGTFRDKGGCLGVSLNDSRKGVVNKSIRPVLLSSYEDGPIVKICSGFNHLAMLSNKGIVLTVGAGDAGQLGRLGPQKRDSSVSHRTRTTMLTPKAVGVRTKAKFENLWCAGYCCFARATDGKIYVWGLNNFFQLGYVPNDPDQSDIHQPIPSEQFSNLKKWTQFAGDHHILALDDKGEVFVIGRGDDSRLGLENNNNQQIITRLNGLENIGGVASSNSTSFAWTKEGAAFAWGFNNEGELGLGVEDSECVQRPTPIAAKSLERCKVVQVSAGGQHTLIMVRKDVEENGATNAD